MTIIQLADGIMRRLCVVAQGLTHLQASQDSSVADLKADLESLSLRQQVTAEHLIYLETRLAEIQATLARIEAAVVEADQAAGISLSVVTTQ